MPVESTEMSIPCKTQQLYLFFYFLFFILLALKVCIGEPEHLHRMRWRIVWTREKNCSTSRHGAGASYQTSHPGISARAIALGRSWPFAAFCYRPCLPVRHWGRDMSAPKPYVTNPTPTHSSRPPLSLQFRVRFRWLIYSREKSFYLSYGRHWGHRLQSVRTRPAKGNVHTCTNFISCRISE